jgi:hypothetical protein
MFDFLILFLTFKLILEPDVKNDNFCSKNYKDNFDKRYHLNDRFIVVYLK